MTVRSLLFLLTMALGAQSSPASLALDVRVFRGATEVTRETAVTVYAAGSRANGTPAPLVASGERQLPLAAGQYDLQLVQHRDGTVGSIAWTTLRLLVAYPNEKGRHLEVLNFDKTWGALQLREEATDASGPPAWSARLLRKDGSEAARGVTGNGYQVLVAPAGTYDVAIEGPRGPIRLQGVEIKPNLTYLRTF